MGLQIIIRPTTTRELLMFSKRPIKYVLTGLIVLTLCLTGNKICDAQGDGAPAAVRYLRVVNGSGGSPGVTIGHRSIIPTALSLGTVFISTTGSGNACTRTAPCDWKTGISGAIPGDVVFFAGGVYFLEVTDRRIYLKGGANNRPIIYESYPGEKAIFDGAHFEPTGSFGGIRISEDYTVLRNVEIRNMPNAGVSIRSNYNRIEGVVIHGNHLTGIAIVNGVDGYSPNDTGGSHNYVEDCIIYDNSDAGLFSDHGHHDGGNSDGIAISSGVDNHILHNTVYANSDDGIDTWRSNDSVVRYNRVSDNGRAAGDGNGIKAGGNLDPNSDVGFRTFAEHNIVYANRARGIDYNAGRDVIFQYNTSYGNGGIGFATSDAYHTRTRYNIAADNGTAPIERDGDTDNSWQRSGTVQFISTNPTSPDFLKPTVGGGFEDIGAYAGLFVPSYPPDRPFTAIPTETNVTYPDYLGSITGPVFGNTITRISDAQIRVFGHPYPKTQSWNTDSTLMRLGNDIIDAGNYARMGTIDGKIHEIKWSSVRFDTLYGLRHYYRDDDNGVNDDFEFMRIRIYPNQLSYETLITFPKEAYRKVLMGPWEGNIDLHDRYVALAAQKTDADYLTVIRYNIENNTTLIKDFPDISWETGLDWGSVSPLGNYILINWLDDPNNSDPDSRGSVYQYDIDINYLRKLSQQGQHGDMGIDADGGEVYVQFGFGGQRRGIWGYHLSSGSEIRLLPDKYSGGHVSCRNYLRPGWCYPSTTQEGYREVFALKLDGSGLVNRFAQTHTTGADNSHGGVNPDGTKILFDSRWGGATSNDRAESFVVEVPN
jgi:parallel beta-helix repeat protein